MIIGNCLYEPPKKKAGNISGENMFVKKELYR